MCVRVLCVLVVIFWRYTRNDFPSCHFIAARFASGDWPGGFFAVSLLSANDLKLRKVESREMVQKSLSFASAKKQNKTEIDFQSNSKVVTLIYQL